MRTTIDDAGRLVIPKHLRERLNLVDGGTVEVTEREGRIEITPATTPMRLKGRGRSKAAHPDAPVPQLTEHLVRDTLEQTRR